jgi:hypothetical protein
MLPAMRRIGARTAIGATLWLLISTTAYAQTMGQGEARITARSDVRMGVESGPGTSGRKLQDMAGALTERLATIRQCYATVAEERPTVQGAMRLRVLLPRGRGVDLRVEEDTTSDRPLARCVTRALERAHFTDVERPANVMVALDFTNSAARGVAETRERAGREAHVETTRDVAGHHLAEGGTEEVRFRVAGVEADRAAAAQRSLRSGIAGFLDCRRRAGRRGMNPEGEITLRLQIPRRGRVTARVMDSSVADTRAPTCMSRALSRMTFEAAAAGRADVTFIFAPRAHIAEAHDE